MDFLLGHTAIVRLLLENGADVNARGPINHTSLSLAAQYGEALHP